MSGKESDVGILQPLPVRELDGAEIGSLADFSRQFSRCVLRDDYEWRGNLDAFNDILRGSFGTPEGPWILRWRNVARAREALGWTATADWLREHVASCPPSSVPFVKQRLSEVEQHQGQTLFDMILQIIRDHGAGGTESEDGIVLELQE